MIYDMKLVEDEFDNVKCRGKIIEVRVNDEKRSKIVRGDKILFHKLPGMDESILVNFKTSRKYMIIFLYHILVTRVLVLNIC